MVHRRTISVLFVLLVVAVISGGPATSHADELPTILEPSVSQPQEFSLLSYNVHGLPETISPITPTRNNKLISPLLNSYDIVLMQEDFFHHANIVRAVEHPFVSVPMKDAPTMLEPGDGLNRLSIFPFQDFERHTWEACNGIIIHQADCGAEKGFSVAWMVLDDDVRMPVVNLHMDAGNAEGDEDARAQQVTQLVTWLQEHAPTGPVIVAGDTNLDIGSAADREALERLMGDAELTDVCTHLECGEVSIDRVFFRGSVHVEIEPVDWARAPEFVDENDEKLSDHNAIAVNFRWRLTKKVASNDDRPSD